MAETGNIAAMAETLSSDLFSEFFWERAGPMNHNWDCMKPEVHEVKTHPSDVVFYYDEPYTQQRTFLQCDLKSYARGSIVLPKLKGALESLAKQVACAEVSEEWQNLYVHKGQTPAIAGLLFVYNHDGEYDKDFSDNLKALQTANLDIPRGSKLVVLGPEDIYWLDNVRYEIVQMRGRRSGSRLPDPQHCKYYYPQLTRKKNLQMDKAKAATLEMLTSKLIVLEYLSPDAPGKRGLVLFYRGKGESSDEFTYLFDYLRHYQLLEKDVSVEIKMFDASAHAKPMFQKAVQSYIEGLAEGAQLTSLAQRVEEIQFSSISQVRTRFSQIEIGMDYE
ncbi:hypothetical protein [Delftia sp. CH05]|uniref:hypothetical protein n=1 Tax=Delftia sp. CH05 TaxID=2692194 RepID=UPI00135D6E96|nr:hypothetical protein [Delftia sp. CH05]MXN28146.1 hypothetical protein [Delftia sp. CH05]